MGQGFAAYIQRMELIAFFSGYALVYAFVHFIAGEHHKKCSVWQTRMIGFLPYAHALSGTLYVGLILKELSNNFSFDNLIKSFSSGWNLFAFISLLFWLPFFNRRKWVPLMHSLVFFYLLIKDIVLQLSYADTNDMVNNDLRIYTASIFINTASLLVIIIFYYSYKAIVNRITAKV
ncbi:hypothetical protein BH09BAC2_BH09BAC2_16260 [soil metagenome]